MDLRKKGIIREIFPEEFQNEENDPSGVLKTFLDILNARAITGAWVSSSSASESSISVSSDSVSKSSESVSSVSVSSESVSKSSESVSSESTSSESSSSGSSSSDSLSSDSTSSSYFSTLVRNSSGLLYGRDSVLNPFVAGDLAYWDAPLAAYSVSISSGRLRVSYPSTVSGPADFRNNQIPSRSKTYLFATHYAPDNGWDSYIGLAANQVDIGPPNQDYVQWAFFTRRSQTAYLAEIVNGSSSTLNSLSTGYVNPGTYSFWMFADGVNMAIYDSYNTTDLTGVCSTLSSGTVGFMMGGWNSLIYCQTFIAMSDRYVTVNGLSTGDTVEIRKSDDTVLASGSESGGSATVDLYKVNITECNKVVIVRAAIDEYTYTVGAGDFICGGDEYEIT